MLLYLHDRMEQTKVQIVNNDYRDNLVRYFNCLKANFSDKNIK